MYILSTKTPSSSQNEVNHPICSSHQDWCIMHIRYKAASFDGQVPVSESAKSQNTSMTHVQTKRECLHLCACHLSSCLHLCHRTRQLCWLVLASQEAVSQLLGSSWDSPCWMPTVCVRKQKACHRLQSECTSRMLHNKASLQRTNAAGLSWYE